MRQFITTGALATFLTALIGCGETNKPVVQVEGKIKLADGKPPPAGTKLLFNPTEGRTGTASATTAADGSFKLTHVSGTSGAEVGKYTVLLSPPTPEDKEFYKLIPKDVAEGGLFAEIKEGARVELIIPKR
jgi:hypothetical protein